MRIAQVGIICTALAVTAAAGVAARQGRQAGSGTQAAGAACKPLETREPNAADQRPGAEGQTRACGVASNVAFDVSVIAKGLENPWAVEPLPGGDLLVTEKPGRMRIVSASGVLGAPIAGVPPVDAQGQGGLLDVALAPGFAKDRTIYWSYAEPREGGNATSVARGVLSADGTRLDDVRVIFRAMPTYKGRLHFGSRLAFGPDGMLFVTLGERSDTNMRPQAQQLDSHMGKILRIRPDGSAPPDNPFAGKPGALPEIWTLGHRNVQAAAFDAQGQLWTIEHGTNGGDELNRIEKGKNYGWPIVAYGEEYSGKPIPGAVTSRPGYEPPVYYWDPVIAPSGAQFHSGQGFPAWRGSLFIGALREKRLVRLVLQKGRVTGEEHLLVDRNQRVRDVREGSGGALYVVTDEKIGELWKISPRR
jgi:glucose/arabinose dehydrogenase